ncbi:MAG TPA: M56 family metallopeptidase [Bacteroidales bacterium]|nr:M56 family metallopeptidase [Bacteroidales bacterium]
MSLIQDLFSDQFLYALGWTLVHSLWQGAIIGLLIALAMIFLQRHTARLRYFIYSLSLFFFAAIGLITFITSFYSYQPEVSAINTLAPNTQYILAAEHATSSNAIHASTPALGRYLEVISAYCRENLPFIVGIWLLGMLASMLRFLGGYALVRRYRTHRVRAVGGRWENRFRQLALQIRVSNKVRLLESALVKVPMAIGFFKPVVLVPLGMLNGVPAQQMEAILVHELAHIYRRDYLMNLIQSILEVIFFYHPVVWWLSGNIRVERENICDDIAITITGNTMEFAKALTNIQEINLAAPGLAAGLSGKNKHRLLNRIRRLTGKPKLHSGFSEGLIAALILMISLAGMSAAAMITYPVDKPLQAELEFAPASSVLPGFSQYPEPFALPDTTIKEKQKAEQAKAESRAKKTEDKALTEKQMQQIAEAEAAVEAQREAIEAQVEAMEAQIESAMEAYRDAMEDFEFDRENYEKQVQKAMKQHEKALQQAAEEARKAGFHSWEPSMVLPYQYLFRDSLGWKVGPPDSLIWHSDSLEGLYFGDWDIEFPEFEDIGWTLDTQRELMELDENLRQLEQVYVPAPNLRSTLLFDGEQLFPMDIGIQSKAKRLVTDELYEDGLIDHGREYVVVIDNRQMLINGEKQTRSVFKKYSRLVESLEDPWQFGDADEFKIFIGH